jgi:hypothetical protein
LSDSCKPPNILDESVYTNADPLSGYTYVKSLQDPIQICDSSGKCLATITQSADKLPLYASENKPYFFTEKSGISCKYKNSPVNPSDCNMYYPSKGCVLAQLTSEEPEGVDNSGGGSSGGGGGGSTGSVSAYCKSGYIYIKNNTSNSITCKIDGTDVGPIPSNTEYNTGRTSGTVSCGQYLSSMTLSCHGSISSIDIKINPNVDNPKPTNPKEPSVTTSNISLKKIKCTTIGYPLIPKKNEWYIVPVFPNGVNINLSNADLNIYYIRGSSQILYSPQAINDKNILVGDPGAYTIYIKSGNTVYYCSAYAKEYQDVSGVPENPIVYLTIAIMYITVSYFALRNIKDKNKIS